MFVNAKALVVIVSCALVAQAQSSASSTTTTAPASQSSTAGLSTCILNCVTQAAPIGGCASYTDLACVCTSTAFQQAAASCLLANCTADDLAAAEQLQNQECGALSSGSVPASTAASSGTSASATQSATSSSAAMALSAPFSFGTLVGTLVASAGALIGAAFVL